MYFVVKPYFGPPAIRPQSNQIQDPLLAPVLKQYADSVDARKGDPEVRLSLGMAYEAGELYEFAEQTYEQLITLVPEEPIGWYRLAVVQERQGDLYKAISSLSEASDRTPKEMAAPFWQLALWQLDIGEVEEAKTSATKASAINPKSPPLLIARVRIALAEQRPEEVIQLLTQEGAMDTIPNNFGWQLLGRAYRATGDLALAEESWSQAGTTRPRWGDPWSGEVANHIAGLREMKQRIGLLANAGNIDQAQDVINEYKQFDASDLVVNRIDAMCDMRKGNMQKAIQKLSALCQSNPKDTFTKLVYAQARMKTTKLRTKNELLSTKKLVEEVIEVQPYSSRALLLLGNVCMLLEELNCAISAYHTCLELDPSNRQALQNALAVLQKTNTWDEHEEIVAIGLKMVPNHPLLKNRNDSEE